MKFQSIKVLWASIGVLAMILLAGCTANIVTDINPDGSGTRSMEYIMTVDEMDSYGYTLTDTFCEVDLESNLSDMPPGTSVSQEQNGDEISCIFETPFASLDELRTIYVNLDYTVSALEFRDNKFYYDVSIDIGAMDTMGFMVYWIVRMPGNVLETNATTQEGNTLTWEAPSEGILNAHATSAMGLSRTWWWVIGIGSLCCCLLVVVAAVVLIIVLTRRKKNMVAAPATPAA